MKLTRNTLILWAFSLISLGLRAQHVEKGRSQYWQGSEPWKGQNAFLENFAKKIGYTQTDSVYFRVPVQFWIYRSNTGEGGLGIDEIRRAMADLSVDNLVSWFSRGTAITPVPETAAVKPR